MRKIGQKGFTLIGLLVVIAIIGILADLVLVALGNAREKANDARIKSNIGQLRTFAEIIYDSNGAVYYDASGGQVGTCFTAPALGVCTSADISANIQTLLADTIAAGGTITSSTVATSVDQFCVESVLNDTNFLCVDNTGAFLTVAASVCGNSDDPPSCT